MRNLLLAALLLVVPCGLADDPKEPPPDLSNIIAELAPSIVPVEVWLQFDKGEEPRGGMLTERCPSCGRFHVSSDMEELVRDERPLETAGYLLDNRRVVMGDLGLHPRFVKSILVRSGDKSIAAKPAAVSIAHHAMLLELDEPVADGRPLGFGTAEKPPYHIVSATRANGAWTIGSASVPGEIAVTQDRRFLTVPTRGIIVDRRGTPLALSFDNELPLERAAWQQSPEKWQWLTAAQHKELLDRIERTAADAIVRVTLNFRSPRADQGGGRRRYRFDDDEGGGDTEQQVLGVVTGPQQVLVLANLKQTVTVRLEEIHVHLPSGAVKAKFSHSLKDYGAFVAELDNPATPAKLLDGSLQPLQGTLLPCAEVLLYGEVRQAYVNHCRIGGFDVGRRRMIFPEVPGDNGSTFIFTREGALAALPIHQRRSATTEERGDSDSAVLTPAEHLVKVLADVPAYADANNIPLTEEQENRIAWLGLELQPLNSELARANHVAEETRDGEIGALVSYVYPGSPAAGAGIEPGAVLVRVHVEGEPKPLDVEASDTRGSFESFPWDRLDQVPEEYYSEIPRPWPPVVNTFTQALTDLGFGRKFTADIYVDGKLAQHQFEIAQSPAHYDSAAKHKSEELGLTVKELTYEVRRYFQKPAEEPGVIVAKIEQGSRGSIAGIKPFEIITHINDQPIKTAADFIAAIASPGELRLSVKRMTRGRIVKIDMSAPAPKKTPTANAEDEGDGAEGATEAEATEDSSER